MGFYGVARGMAAFLNFGAFICLLLVCISSPAVKSLCLFSANFIDGTVVRAGLWGYCNDWANGTQTCVGSQLGYTLDGSPYAGRLHDNIQNGMVNNVLIGKPLTIAFILWPLACAQTFFAALGATSNWRPLSLLTVLSTAGAFGLVLTVWIVTCNVAVPAKNRMQAQFPANEGHVGNVIWLGLAALIALFISQIAMFAGHVPSKAEKQNKRMNGKPGKRAPFGNVIWSDESLPRDYGAPSRSDRKSRNGFGSSPRTDDGGVLEDEYPMDERKSARSGRSGRSGRSAGTDRGYGGSTSAAGGRNGKGRARESDLGGSEVADDEPRMFGGGHSAGRGGADEEVASDGY